MELGFESSSECKESESSNAGSEAVATAGSRWSTQHTGGELVVSIIEELLFSFADIIAVSPAFHSFCME